MAGLLAGLLEDTGPLTPERLTAMCRFANAAGALATTKRGAIPALPTRAEVMELIGANSAPKTPEVADGPRYNSPSAPLITSFSAAPATSRCRKLLPSLYLRDKAGQFTPESRIIAVSRSQLDTGEYLAKAEEALRLHLPAREFDDAAWSRFRDRLELRRMSMPPRTTAGAIWPDIWTVGRCHPRLLSGHISRTCSARSPNGCAPPGWSRRKSRVVLEKPIGRDLASATPDQRRGRRRLRRRADLPHRPLPRQGDGPEPDGAALRQRAVRAAVERRRTSTTSRSPWPRPSASRSRGGYYDTSGALRDMVQNHMLQLLCLVAMEPPVSLDADAVRDEKLKVLRSLKPIGDRERCSTTHRARPVPGRRRRRRRGAGLSRGAGIGSDSHTETFVALKAEIAQLALGRRAVLPAHRQAAAGRGSRRSSSSSARCRTRSSRARPATSSPTGWSSACSRTRAIKLCT